MIKKILLFTTIVIAMFVGFKTYTYFTSYIKYTDQEMTNQIEPIKPMVHWCELPEKEIDSRLYNGRLYISATDIIKNFGGSIYFKNHNELDDNSFKDILIDNNTKFINVLDITEKYNLFVEFDNNNNSVSFYNVNNTQNNNIIVNQNTQAAYIRLEDIMADGLDIQNNNIPNYSHENLSKLRVIANYLDTNNQQYYIAWIPLYTNPANKYSNDLRYNYNLYNADFLYTLDYMALHNGKIGLHGYTHQYGKDKSAVGYEWGDKTPYSRKEQMLRMIYAKNVAQCLAIEENFFEFPHYSITNKQLKMAENYFDVIYQRYPESDETSIVEIKNKEGKITKYIPTPADYLYYDGYTNEMIWKLKANANDGKIISLFIHPPMEYSHITINKNNGNADITYERNSNIQMIVEALNNMNYQFKYF